MNEKINVTYNNTENVTNCFGGVMDWYFRASTEPKNLLVIPSTTFNSVNMTVNVQSGFEGVTKIVLEVTPTFVPGAVDSGNNPIMTTSFIIDTRLSNQNSTT
jgi:hypothetical protein